MSWPRQVREDALVASGRRCALCTVFVGTHLELHHICPQSEGGDANFENCIPLCLNCHADVGHYDTTHPRGNRYTPDELARHRDRLFQQVAEGILSPEASPPTPPHVSEADRALYKAIKEQLPPAVVGRFLQDHNFAGEFPVPPWGAINDYLNQVDDPDFSFIDPPLAALHRELTDSLRRLLKAASGKVWRSQSSDWLGVPGEWTDPSHVRHKDFWPAVEALNTFAREASEAYKALIRECRFRLNMP